MTPATTRRSASIPTLRQDRLALGLLVATTLALAALLLWLATSYSELPDLLPLHFDAQGNADRIGERREILVLPAIAGLVYGVNVGAGLLLRLRWQRPFAAYLLWAGALLVQVLIWLAVWNISH